MTGRTSTRQRGIHQLHPIQGPDRDYVVVEVIGRVVQSRAVAIAALGQEAAQRIFRTIAVYDDFRRENDPYGEHDFGAFDAAGQRIFFKIDYFDKRLNMHSPDPADPSVTERVITIMLAEEY